MNLLVALQRDGVLTNQGLGAAIATIVNCPKRDSSQTNVEDEFWEEL